MRVPLPAGGSDGASQGVASEAKSLPRDEWIGLPDTELAELLQAAELQANQSAARLAAHTVNAARAQAALAHWTTRAKKSAKGPPASADCPSEAEHAALVDDKAPSGLRIELREFASRYSPRNLCIVGHPQWDSSVQIQRHDKTHEDE